MNPNRTPYTKREDEIIKAMHSKGFKPDEIATVLKSRLPSAIKDRGYNLGLKWTVKPEIDETLFKKLCGGK